MIRELYISCIIKYNSVNCANQQPILNDFTEREILTFFSETIYVSLYKYESQNVKFSLHRRKKN